MNNIFESSDNSANCQLCPSDEPFFIPFTDEDFFAIRLQVPYALVELEGGSIPIGVNFDVAIYDELGTTSLFDFGDMTSTKFNVGYRNNATDKLAEYQLYLPVPFADQGGAVHIHRYVDVTEGDLVQVVGAGYNEVFYFSQDQIPYPLYKISDTKLGIPVLSGSVGLLIVNVNNASATIKQVYPVEVGVAGETGCFRFRISLSYPSGSGNVYHYFTKPFKRIKCDEVLRVIGTYPGNTIDCNSNMHQSFNVNYTMFAQNMLIGNVFADCEEISSVVKKTYNSNSFNYKSEKQRRFSFKSDPCPKWYADHIENMVLAKLFEINNTAYIMEGVESVFKDSDIDSVSFQNIDVNLQLRKCEKVFSC